MSMRHLRYVCTGLLLVCRIAAAADAGDNKRNAGQVFQGMEFEF